MDKYAKQTAKVVGFIASAFIVGMIVLNIVTPDRDFSPMENRSLELMPSFSWDSLLSKKFTTDFEDYIADQFALRDFWIGVKTDLARAMGQNVSNGVYLGRDGYLLQEFREPAKQDLTAKLKALNTFASATPKLKKYFMLAPNAVDILKDKLPPYAPGNDEQVYLDEIEAGLDKSFQVVDVYGTLTAHRKEAVFYKTDHHWTTLGAFYAYQKLGQMMGFSPHQQSDYQIKRVTDSFWGSLYSESGFKHIAPDSIELYIPKKPEAYDVKYYDTDEEGHSLYTMTNLTKKDKYTVFFNGNQSLITIQTSAPGGKKLLVLKDSYANSFVPFLTDQFSEIYMVDLRYYSDDLLKLIQDNGIDNALFLYNVNTFAGDKGLLQLSAVNP